jgi:hypothetical protein
LAEVTIASSTWPETRWKSGEDSTTAGRRFWVARSVKGNGTRTSE